MNKFFSYCEHWGNGLSMLLWPILAVLMSGLYAVPIILIGEIFNINFIYNNEFGIYLLFCIIIGPFMVSKYGPNN